MYAKCKVCGAKLDTKIAYKVVRKNKNEYYCNEQEYLEHVKATALSKNIIELSCDICGGDWLYPLVTKEINIIKTPTNAQQMYDYLKYNKEYIMTQLCRKSFSTDYALVRYFIAIVRNNYPKFVVKPEAPKKQTEEVYENKGCQHRRKRRSISECMDDYFKTGGDNN